MGFLSGRMTALRFRVRGEAPPSFGEDQLNLLAEHKIGRQRIATADGVETGWTAGDSVLDTDFQLAKNVVNDALLFDLRADTDRLPGDLLKAYYEADLKALAKSNPSGFPSAKQKRAARESARDRLEQEAKDGRFKKRKCYPVMWDLRSNEVLFGVSSFTQVDRLSAIFERTFGMGLECVTAGHFANYREYGEEEVSERLNAEGVFLSKFVAGGPEDVAWIADSDSWDYLGNEFLLWLWYFTDVESDTVTLGDKSEVTVMLARVLVVDCPRGQTGIDGFKSDGPSRLPEARRAIQAGKLPRKAGLVLVRHAEQFELTLHAESLCVQSAKLPQPGDEVTEPRGKLEHRVDATRSCLEAVDGLYAEFLRRRLGKEWPDELAAMQKWLKRAERAA